MIQFFFKSITFTKCKPKKLVAGPGLGSLPLQLLGFLVPLYLLGCRHPGSPWSRRRHWTTPGRSEPLPHCRHLLPVHALLRKAGLVTNTILFFQLLQSKTVSKHKKLRLTKNTPLALLRLYAETVRHRPKPLL